MSAPSDSLILMTLSTGNFAATANVHTLTRLKDDSPAWAILRSPLAPAILSILGTVFTGDRQQIEGSELVHAIGPLLTDIREQTDADLPRSAAHYLTEWVKAGWLIRRSPQGQREEIYELSMDTLAALDYIQTLAAPTRTVTRSRLATLITSLQSLAADTDPDETTAIARLEEQQAALQARIDRIRERGVEAISDDEAIEKTREVLGLLGDLPTDFARVRSDIEGIDTNLRRAVVEEELTASEVLENVFRGVDLISDSEAGRAFNGFYELLFDREQGARLDATVEAVLSRDFIDSLSPTDRTQLRHLVGGLEGSAVQVQDSMTSLSRSLRRFVQSREAAAQQALVQSITSAQQLALRVAQHLTTGRHPMDIELELSGFQPRSISTWHLHDPADYRITEEVEDHTVGDIELAAMYERIRASEIDWPELHAAVNDVRTTHPSPSIAYVLGAHPATQGLASVVGLIRLADSYGERGEGTETLPWTSTQGQRLRARFPVWRFTQELPELNAFYRPSTPTKDS